MRVPINIFTHLDKNTDRNGNMFPPEEGTDGGTGVRGKDGWDGEGQGWDGEGQGWNGEGQGWDRGKGEERVRRGGIGWEGEGQGREAFWCIPVYVWDFWTFQNKFKVKSTFTFKKSIRKIFMGFSI